MMSTRFLVIPLLTCIAIALSAAEPEVAPVTAKAPLNRIDVTVQQWTRLETGHFRFSLMIAWDVCEDATKLMTRIGGPNFSGEFRNMDATFPLDVSHQKKGSVSWSGEVAIVDAPEDPGWNLGFFVSCDNSSPKLVGARRVALQTGKAYDPDLPRAHVEPDPQMPVADDRPNSDF